MSTGGWEEIFRSIEQSQALLQAVWECDEEAVAKGMQRAHFETSHLQYNDENALSYTISLALYAARQQYTVVRELPAGKGFADIVLVPRPQYGSIPGIIVELKWNKEADTAVEQIMRQKYPLALEKFAGDLLLVGVSYDKKTKEHHCKITRMKK
jgi:hypothetical protein